jgi:DNA-binding phage protein
MNHERVATEVLRALRGRRSQAGLSRRLGYGTNVVYRWEAGLRSPTAAEFFRLAARGGVDVPRAIERFERPLAAAIANERVGTPEHASALLRRLAVGHTIVSLAKKSRLSRFAIQRALAGTAEPRLPDFLRLVDAATQRLLDWIAVFVDPTALPSVARAWQKLEAMRRLAYDLPYSEAVLAALESEGYGALARHRTGWLAQCLGLSADVEAQTLGALVEAGVVTWSGTHWIVQPDRLVDTRRDGARYEVLKRFWVAEASRRFEAGTPGLLAYTVFTASQRDLQRVADLYRDYYTELRRIVARSTPGERVVLVNVHFCPLDGKPPLDASV